MDNKGKELVEEMLYLLVKMSTHCKTLERTDENKVKCSNCSMSRYFSLGNHGCFLVETLENYEFIDSLKSTCRYQNIEFESKLNKAVSIFVTECEEE